MPAEAEWMLERYVEYGRRDKKTGERVKLSEWKRVTPGRMFTIKGALGRARHLLKSFPNSVYRIRHCTTGETIPLALFG